MVAMVALVAVGPAIAAAQTISFVHSGQLGSGSIGTTNFVRRNFTITAVGDVSTRQVFAGGFSIDHSSAAINIDGVGNFSFTSGTRTFVNNGAQIVGFSRAGIDGLDLFNGPTGAMFGAWNMLSSIGPVNGVGRLTQWDDVPTVQTTGGQLLFNSDNAISATFQATVGPTVVVPEPSTYAMLAVAMSALGVIARRRRSV
jgi:hypothetical protein